MKKGMMIAAALVLALGTSTAAQAGGRYGGGGGHHGGGGSHWSGGGGHHGGGGYYGGHGGYYGGHHGHHGSDGLAIALGVTGAFLGAAAIANTVPYYGGYGYGGYGYAPYYAPRPVYYGPPAVYYGGPRYYRY